MLESFREGRRVAPVLPLLMALACKPGSVPPSAVTDIASETLTDAHAALARCNASMPSNGTAIWELNDNPDPFGSGDWVLCEDIHRNGSAADHVHFDGIGGQNWYLTTDGTECTFPVQLGCGPCQLVDDGDGK